MLPPPPISTLFPYTTLFRSADLIPRFYDVTSGRITIDGVDIRDVTIESLRSQIGRSEEHTSELQSHSDLVCRLLLEKKKIRTVAIYTHIEHIRDTVCGQETH